MHSGRGATCLEYAIMLGVIGNLVVLMSMFVFPKVELARSLQAGHAGEICR